MAILLVEDDFEFQISTKTYLEENGYDVDTANNGLEAWKLINIKRPELIIADIIMPKMDGLQLCRRIKSKADLSDIPIILLTAKSQEVDIILGLEYGADDYITKPLSLRELLARIRAILRRVNYTGDASKYLIYKNISLNCIKHEATYDYKKIFLTNKEFDLLRLFLLHPSEMLSRHEIIDFVWGDNYVGDIRIVDLHIKNLRKKIKTAMKNNNKNFYFIKSIRNKGYMLDEQTIEEGDLK